MQAAFVNIGLEKDAFLYVMDVFDNTEEFTKILSSNSEAEDDENAAPDNHSHDLEMDPILTASIDELLREGQHVLVQVSREPMGSKGARVTSHITLPGRYLVYMPTVDHIGVSKKIEDENSRTRLREMLVRLRPSRGGYIVRTVGEVQSEDDFESDIRVLNNLWETIQHKAECAGAPSLIHRDLDPIFRSLRDLLTTEIEEIIADTDESYALCCEYIDTIQPPFRSQIRLHLQSVPIFEAFGVEEEIRKALQRKVWLRSGGYIVIEQTEALVAIDVNTGKYVGRRNLEETITKTNIEAARSIARQIRLRDLGGIIIVDFIDMEQDENRQKVLKTLESEIKKDRSRVSLSPFTHLGLVQITRKRVKRSLERILLQPCFYCGGRGLIKSVDTICDEIFQKFKTVASSSAGQDYIIRAHPKVIDQFTQGEFDILEMSKFVVRGKINFESDLTLHMEDFHIISMPTDKNPHFDS